VKLAMLLSISGAGSPSHSPTRGGRRVSDGSSRRSKRSKIVLTRSRSAASCAWARRTNGPGIFAPSPASPRVQRASRSGWAIPSASPLMPSR